MNSIPFYILAATMAGVGVPIMAAMNAHLGARLASPVAATLVLFTVAACASLVIYVLAGRPALTPAAAEMPPAHYYFAGLLVVFYGFTITWVAPRFGVGNAIFCVLLGQLAAATIIDHFGLFGAVQTPVTPRRIIGLCVMILGIWLARREL